MGDLYTKWFFAQQLLGHSSGGTSRRGTTLGCCGHYPSRSSYSRKERSHPTTPEHSKSTSCSSSGLSCFMSYSSNQRFWCGAASPELAGCDPAEPGLMLVHSQKSNVFPFLLLVFKCDWTRDTRRTQRMLRTVIHKPRQGIVLHLTSLCEMVLDQQTHLL